MTFVTEAATSKYVQAGDLRIHYNEVGAGPTVIFLHGAGPGASSWSNFETNIEAFAAHYRVLLVDMPQYGRSAKVPVAAPKLSNFARVIRDFMDAIGLDKAAFVGNSYGGQVSLKIAIDYPERVTNVVIIGSAPVIRSVLVPFPAEGVKLIGSYYRDDGPSPAKMRALLQALVFDSTIITDEVVAERYKASIDPDSVRVHSLPPGPRQDLTGELDRITAPTLVVWGMDDRAGALDVGLLVTRSVPNSEMHIFNRCGHWAQVEHSARFNEIVLAFLRRHQTVAVAT